ncbi:MAG: FtsH protease activity modulator HflK [Burkholderiales bacterium]|nr:FtsH protease activity modulator HflK [Burkholderiales bacterium]MDE1927836.1 FtsH protease activity modulator HflK [Burkholderiales bacterium]MDE2160840.1 FtsH protease activity modulator HflK [Burkholderiales bacterium]MDE2505400.1 FtsH protease activity modulator HflK [Burkholderiales bacterium]
MSERPTPTLIARLRDHLYANRGDGPPDLDELWRDFNRKLGKLFGGRGGGKGSGDEPPSGAPFQPDMRSAGIGFALIAVVALLIWLGSGFFIVQEGNRAVITTFGKYSGTVDAGFQWRLPYPIQAHEIVAVTQLQSVEVGRNAVIQATGLRDSSMLTQDENIVDIRFTVQYRRADARDYLFNNSHPDEAVVQAAESAVREIVGRSRVDQVLYEQRDAIAAELVKSIQAQLDRLKAGIVISNVNMQNVQVPDAVQSAFNDAVKAGADRDRLKNEGEAYASDVIPKARGTASRLLEEAEGYKARVIAQAQGDAQRFRSVVAEYEKAPAVTRDRLYLETMQQVYSNVTKILIDTHAGNNLLYLPLDKLLEQQNAAAAAGAVTVLPAPTSAPAPSQSQTDPSGTQSVDIRSRDNARSRDREGR